MIRAGYWGSDRFYRITTAPISMNYALRRRPSPWWIEEGLEGPPRPAYLKNHRALKAGLTAMGISYVTAEGHQLPQLSCVRIPDGVDDLTVRKRLLTEWGIEIGGGLGPFKGQAWRIGLMGQGARPANVTLFLAALETCLRDLGHTVEPGAALAAASEAYSGNPPVPSGR